MNILLEKSITLTHILCVLCSFWRFLPFQAYFNITVIPVKRRSRGCTLRFLPLSTRRWFVHQKSSRSAFFSAIFYDLRSLHSGTCLSTKTPRAFRWKRAFSTRISKFASFWLCFEQADWTLVTLIDHTTRGREKINLVPKFLPRPCPVCLFKAQPERNELGNSGRKRSFSAKCAGCFGKERSPKVQ